MTGAVDIGTGAEFSDLEKPKIEDRTKQPYPEIEPVTTDYTRLTQKNLGLSTKP